MLHDLRFLEAGAMFPPKSELARLKTYSDNEKLFNQEIGSVLIEHEARIRNIDARFADMDWTSYTGKFYEMELNYFQLISLKTADMVCGEPPTLGFIEKREPVKLPQNPEEATEQDEYTAELLEAEKAEAQALQHDNLMQLCNDTQLFSKLQSVALGVSYAGDVPVRVYVDENGKNNFTVISPSMWFPVVDREIKDKVLYHVLAWVECVDERRNKYELNVQLHEKGKYTNIKYAIKGEPQKAITNDYGEILNVYQYEIGGVIESSPAISTGLDDFAIVVFQNVVPPASIYALNDYDRVTPIIAELNVRYTLEDLVLDKHSAPMLGVPQSALFQNRQGEWTTATGGVVRLKQGEPAPQYITWDASLQANHHMIEKLEKHLFSLSEMGAVIDDASFGASQGFEALETRMTNAKLKARRICTGFTSPLKELVALLSQKGYARIERGEISVQWNDGLPQNEFRETDIALKKVGNRAIYDTETVLVEHFGKTKDEAERIATKLTEENQTSGFAGQYASLLGQSMQADTVDEPTDEPENEG